MANKIFRSHNERYHRCEFPIEKEMQKSLDIADFFQSKTQE